MVGKPTFECVKEAYLKVASVVFMSWVRRRCWQHHFARRRKRHNGKWSSKKHRRLWVRHLQDKRKPYAPCTLKRTTRCTARCIVLPRQATRNASRSSLTRELTPQPVTGRNVYLTTCARRRSHGMPSDAGAERTRMHSTGWL